MPPFRRNQLPGAVSLAALLATMTACATTPAPSSPVGAHASLVDAQGRAVGSAQFSQSGKDISVSLSVTGIAPGPHGAHVHMTGQCDAPQFQSAGGHWNPANVHHGLQNPQGHHKGDMPNLDVSAGGDGTLSFTIVDAEISGGPAALLDADGAAIVIHATADDMMSDPAGNAGGRIACGVIEPG